VLVTLMMVVGGASSAQSPAQSPAEGLARATELLRAKPGNADAAWARAMALRGLELPLTAAEAFAALAARGVRSDEARKIAGELRAEVTGAERDRLAAEAAGREMIKSGLPPSLELVRAYPGIIRRDLYDALRTADSGPRALGLVGVAQALDAIAGGEVLAARVRAVAARASADAEAARAYAIFALDPTKRSGVAVDVYFKQRSRRRDWDRALGLRVLAGWDSAGDLRYAARQTHDPWWTAMADEIDGRNLARAVERCLAAHIEYRCAFLEYKLAQGQYPESAEGTAHAGLRRARAAAVDPRDLPRRLLILLSELTRARGATGLADAYVAEARASMP
jgi:hypothetical protein